MPDFFLELLSEEIPARMQAKAQADLARLFADRLAAAGLSAQGLEAYATPRRLTLIARGLPERTEATREETKGPRVGAPPQALEGFLRKTGLAQDQLVERGGVYYAVVERPGRATSSVLAEAVPAMIRAFPWPKSMRWGEASASTESLRWVRPLQGIVALLGEEIVEFEIAGIRSGAATVGHRFHHPGAITIGSANDYVEKLRACHVVVDPAERRRIIAEGAANAAAAAGLTLVEDEGLLAENAGLTEWPVPLLGSFDPAFLEVPREVIQLTMRTNQKYFALLSSPERGGGPAKPVEGGTRPAERAEAPLHHPADGPPPRAGEDFALASNFVCTANIEAADGGAAIVRGNERVLSARLSDAKFFWEQDLDVPLEEQAKKLDQIVFHEKLGTVADKVERVAKLARWLVEEGIVSSLSPQRGEGRGEGERAPSERPASGANSQTPNPLTQPSPHGGEGSELATLAETAARLSKADLVTAMVGEFPELQGIIGGHLARAQGLPAEVADAIRDHYKPVGQGDEVPTAPVTVAVSLADKLDTLFGFFTERLVPTGSKDPFALRRAAVSAIQLITVNNLRAGLAKCLLASGYQYYLLSKRGKARAIAVNVYYGLQKAYGKEPSHEAFVHVMDQRAEEIENEPIIRPQFEALNLLIEFFADRLKVQQREAGVRHDLIDAVFALGGEDDLVRLLARVKALQSFVETPEGADLLAGYKRAANILRKEGYAPSPRRGEGSKNSLSYTPLPEETALIAALESAEPRAREAVAREDFEGAMAALASLRAPVDAFFDTVTVNDPDPAKRDARLGLLARMRDAVHQVADFSRIEG